MSEQQHKVMRLLLILGLLCVGFLMGLFAANMQNSANNERLFNMIRSNDIVKQACAEVAIQNNEAYNWEFIDWCVEKTSKVKRSK